MQQTWSCGSRASKKEIRGEGNGTPQMQIGGDMFDGERDKDEQLRGMNYGKRGRDV
jgi:hypothetical protein